MYIRLTVLDQEGSVFLKMAAGRISHLLYLLCWPLCQISPLVLQDIAFVAFGLFFCIICWIFPIVVKFLDEDLVFERLMAESL